LLMLYICIHITAICGVAVLLHNRSKMTLYNRKIFFVLWRLAMPWHRCCICDISIGVGYQW